MRLGRPLVVLDLETTGTWIEKDRIIEIGMIRLETDGREERYRTRVNPGMPVPAFVTKLTGIGDPHLREAPAFAQIAPQVLSFIGEADLGGFNVERFDLPILERELFEAGHVFSWRNRGVFDAQKIYHYFEKRDLTAAYRFYCQKDLVNAHSALDDASATLDILGAQVLRYGGGDDRVEALNGFERERSVEFYDQERKFRWWNGELYPVFGKYGRKYSLREIARKDRGYLKYLLTTDFGRDAKELLEGALEGRFPTPPPAVGG